MEELEENFEEAVKNVNNALVETKVTCFDNLLSIVRPV